MIKTEISNNLFNYAELAPNDANEVRAAAERIRVRMKRTAEDIVAIGLDLIAVKEKLPHGAFLPWVKAEFEMGERITRNFMKVAEHYNGKTAIIADLTPTVLYELVAPSTPETVREIIHEKAVSGENVTVEEVKRLKRELAEKDQYASQEHLNAETARAEIERIKQQNASLLEGQKAAIEKARLEERAKVEAELTKIKFDAEKNDHELREQKKRFETVKREAEKAALEKAKAEAANLAASEISKRQHEIDAKKAELKRLDIDIERRSSANERHKKEIEEHEKYLKSIRGIDIEARSLLEDLGEINRVLALSLVTIDSLEHEHDEHVYKKIRSTSDMCKKMAQVLDGISCSKLAYEADIIDVEAA